MTSEIFNQISGLFNRRTRDKDRARTLAFLLYEFKKLPSDIVGKKARIVGTIGDMPVNLRIEFDSEPLESISALLDFLKYKADLEQKALKRHR